MRTATDDSPSPGPAGWTPGDAPRAGKAPQMAYLVSANPKFGIRADWWTGVVLQQACQALVRPGS